jgi:hypothetical protein
MATTNMVQELMSGKTSMNNAIEYTLELHKVTMITNVTWNNATLSYWWQVNINFSYELKGQDD